ncbi:EamA family transporter [Domibacillus aminovorans]|uniref:EamA domain-containing protein n=1 Tax=Domibacillus aminovorans TaxID=29332 RepID=A0A177L8A5_9BACI|nr:EamA family transporter [Domibacillus aminovorans]OAH61527.1 hypothetical protein AWH49_12235 [Domibacillus aminovorans]
MSLSLYLPLALAVLSFVLYNIFQKSIAPNADPYLSLIVTYIVAGITAAIAYFVSKGDAVRVFQDFRQLNWATFALGFAVVGIELGFLFAYRNGWNISVASLLVNVSVGLILIPVGLLFFREHIAPANYIGIVLCIAGLILIAKN